MKTRIFILATIVTASMSLLSCSNFDDTADLAKFSKNETKWGKDSYINEDIAMQDFLNKIDELSLKYNRPAVCGIGTKWGKRILCGMVDGVAGTMASPIAPPIGEITASIVASGLYEDYLGWVEVKCHEHGYEKPEDLYAPDFSGPADSSLLDGVILNVNNSTIFLADTSKKTEHADSVGCMHNELLASLRKNGKRYVNLNGELDYDGIHHDALRICLLSQSGKILPPDSIAQANMQNNDANAISSAIRNFTTSLVGNFNPTYDIDFVTAFKIARRNSTDKLNIDQKIYDEISSLGERIMKTSSNLTDTEVINYCKEIDTTIQKSKLQKYQKTRLKTLNNIFVNSFYYWQ